MKTFMDFGIVVPSGAQAEFDTTCPKCSASRKKKHARCLSVNTEKGVFNCAHCGWSGGIGAGEKSYDAPWRKPEFRRPAPVELSQPPAVEFLGKRGIAASVVSRNGIGVRSVYMPQVEDHVPALVFPYRRNGDLVNVKYRDRQKNFRMETGAERILYGLDDIDPKCCVIVEGEIDKLSVETSGIVSCVSVPDGAPSANAKNYASKFTFLDADADRLEGVQEWILAVDSDEPGQRLEAELARRLGREKCRRVQWPGECKDANDVLISHGPDVLRECIESAVPLPIEGVFSVNDLSSSIDRLYANGWERGISTGWDELDRFFTVRPGELTVVTGIPNSGKSNWVDALIVNLARLEGWRFAIFSPENQPIADHAARFYEKWAMEPFGSGPTPRMSPETKEKAREWAHEHLTWILPDDDTEWTVDTVLDRARQLVLRRGITGIVIDPWNELEHALEPGMTETVYIGRALKRIRQFARRHSVHVFLVAHPQKMYREDGKYPVPTLYDISGSANFRNKADNGIVVWRDFQSDAAPVEIHVQKVRFRQVGRIGFAKLHYQKVTQTYTDPSFHAAGNDYSAASRGR